MSTDIMLVQSNYFPSKVLKYKAKEIPLNLAYLSSYLEKYDISTEILDLELFSNPHKELIKKIQELKPKIVAFTAYTLQITNSHKLARFVKKQFPNIVTLVGGLHASALPKKTLEEFKSFDYLIYGEGFVPLRELVEKLLNGSEKKIENINGLVFRQNGQVIKNKPLEGLQNLNKLPFPARHKLVNGKYAAHIQKIKQKPSTCVISSIGCNFGCKFCSVGLVNKQLRVRNPKNIVAEIEESINKYKIKEFRFCDDSITSSPDNLVKLCNLIIKKRLQITWSCQSRVDQITEDILKIMNKAGCHHITYGLDAVNKTAQKEANKITNLEESKNVMKLTKKIGLGTTVNLILGFRGETEEEIHQTINFAKILSPDIVNFYILKAYPGSAIYEEAKKNNTLEYDSWEDYSLFCSPVVKSHLNANKIQKLLKYAYRSFYFRPGYIAQRLKKLVKSPLQETKMCLTGVRLLWMK